GDGVVVLAHHAVGSRDEITVLLAESRERGAGSSVRTASRCGIQRRHPDHGAIDFSLESGALLLEVLARCDEAPDLGLDGGETRLIVLDLRPQWLAIGLDPRGVFGVEPVLG